MNTNTVDMAADEAVKWIQQSKTQWINQWLF